MIFYDVISIIYIYIFYIEVGILIILEKLWVLKKEICYCTVIFKERVYNRVAIPFIKMLPALAECPSTLSLLV